MKIKCFAWHSSLPIHALLINVFALLAEGHISGLYLLNSLTDDCHHSTINQSMGCTEVGPSKVSSI